MKKSAFLALLFALTSAASASGLEPGDVIACENNYFGATRITDDGDIFKVSFEARGFLEIHPLANLLQLPQSPKLVRGEMKILKSQCLAEAGLPQIACRGQNLVAVFFSDDGSVVTKILAAVTVKAGVLGAGADSSQRITFDVSAADGTGGSHTEEYAASYNGSTNRYKLCGRNVGE